MNTKNKSLFNTSLKFIIENQRALILLGVFFAEVGFGVAFWVFQKDLIIFIVKKAGKYSFTSLLSFLIAAPYAYTIWFWRDKNKKEDIENARKTIENEKVNIRLTNFHKLQAWAAGFECNETMRISAIYQLREYANGNQGESFKRPTLEIFRSLLESIVPTDSKLNDYNKERAAVVIPDYLHAVHTIICEESKKLDKKYLRSFDFRQSNLIGADFSDADLSGCNFHRADLDYANFNNANLRGVNFEKAFLPNANFRNAILDENLDFGDEPIEFPDNGEFKIVKKYKAEQGILIRKKDITFTNFGDAYLHLSDFRKAKIGKYTRFEKVKFRNTIWIDGTVIPFGFSGFNEMPAHISDEDLEKMKHSFHQMEETEKEKQRKHAESLGLNLSEEDR